MGYDQRSAGRVRRLLARRKDIVEKRMVGGLSFGVNGCMCCGVVGSDLMVRVGRGNYESALARPHVKPMQFAGRTLAAFVLVAPDGYRTDAALAKWVQQGIDFVHTLPVERSRRQRRPARPSATSTDPAL